MIRKPRTTASLSETAVGRDGLEQALIALAGDLLGFLRHHAGDREVADDLAQETLAQALAALDELRDPRALRGWLFRIAVNLFNDHLRRQGTSRLASEPLPEPHEPGSRQPERVALARELDAVLRQELHRLPERQRSVLMLHGLDGCDTRSIARMLGITPAAVKMSLFHARERMRLRLARYLGRSLQRKQGAP